MIHYVAKFKNNHYLSFDHSQYQYKMDENLKNAYLLDSKEKAREAAKVALEVWRCQKINLEIGKTIRVIAIELKEVIDNETC